MTTRSQELACARGLLEVGGDDDALAGRESVVLHDVRGSRRRRGPRARGAAASARRTSSRTTGSRPARASSSPTTCEAAAHAHACDRVVIEEFLDGPEVSLFAITDGETVVPLQPAQDFKRALDGDEGPNTGGMGAYSPLPWADPKLVDEVLETVLQPTVDELRRRGTPFSGLLYAGLAITSRGVRVIEFNARFGDPETQVVLARLKTPLAGLLLAAATAPSPTWSRCAGATTRRSPWSSPRTTTPAPRAPATRSTGLDEVAAQDAPHAYVLHAGTSATATRSSARAAGCCPSRRPARTSPRPATAPTGGRPHRPGRLPAPHGHRGEGGGGRATAEATTAGPGSVTDARPGPPDARSPPRPRSRPDPGPDPCRRRIHLSPKPFHRVSDAPSG